MTSIKNSVSRRPRVPFIILFVWIAFFLVGAGSLFFAILTRDLARMFPDSDPLAMQSSPTLLPQIDLSFAQPEIIGFEYEVRADAAAVVRPSYFYAYDAAGEAILNSLDPGAPERT